MLITTEAIVLNHIAYSDNKRIITLFSRQEGLLSAMLRSGNRKSTKVSLLEPFSTVEIIAKRGNGSLVYINDISPLKIYKTIPFDAEKRLTTLFMAEVVYRTIREQSRDTSLYEDYIATRFHLRQYTGIQPNIPTRIWTPTRHLSQYGDVLRGGNIRYAKWCFLRTNHPPRAFCHRGEQQDISSILERKDRQLRYRAVYPYTNDRDIGYSSSIFRITSP